MKEQNRMPAMLLSQKLVLGSMFLVLLTVGLTVIMVIKLNLKLQERRVEEELHNIGEMLAVDPLVVHACREKRSNTELIIYLNDLFDIMEAVDVLSLSDMESHRLYLADMYRSGNPAVSDSVEAVLKGQRYFSRTAGHMGWRKRYFTPVIDPDNGKQIGFVIVGSLFESVKSQRDEILLGHLGVALIVLCVAAASGLMFARNIKTTLLGFEPVQISRSFLVRYEVLNSLEEGIAAVDNTGHLVMVNKAANALLGLRDDDLQKKVLLDDIFPQIRIRETLDSGEPSYNNGITWGDVNILCDRIPVNEDGSVLGAVAILRNRTEQTRLAEELTGVKHLVDALRSNTHEFMNKLHVILGLLRIGEPQEAEKYIDGISREHSEVIAPVMQKIQNITLGALILGKMSHCRELDINFTLVGTSSVPAKSNFLSGNAFETLVGNLLENSIEAVNAKSKEDGAREVSLLVHEDEQALIITVDDTGLGMTEEEVERIRKGGYSTKGRHRGTGMRLIHSVLVSNHGEMQIDSEKGVGTSITVCFTKEEKQ